MNNIQRQLSQADPMNHVALHELPDAAVKALAQEIVMHEQSTVPSPIRQPAEIRPSRPRPRRRRLMMGLLAGIIFVPTAAVAAAGGMHTGFFAPSSPDGHASMNEPREEFLNSNDPGISTVVQGLTREFPLPPGASYSLLLKRYPTKVNEYVQRTNLAQQVAYYAHCAWYEHWLNGDAAQRAADQPTIDAIPTWKYWHFAIDDTTGENGGLDWLNAIAAETRVGKTTKITQEIKVNCGYGPGMWQQTPNPSPKR
ncbi:MAG: hypothetical protein ABI903_16150 [Actinomycetota bacterium]